MAFPDSTDTGKPSRWTPILTQCPNRKKLVLERVSTFHNPFQTSPTPPLPRKNVQHACSTLYSMPSLHTVWCGNQCSVLCFACCSGTLHHLHTSNANAYRALVPQYRNVSVVVNLRVVMKRRQTLCTTSTTGIPWHGIVQSCSTVTLCILHFVGGFPRSTLSVPALGAFFIDCGFGQNRTQSTPSRLCRLGAYRTVLPKATVNNT